MTPDEQNDAIRKQVETELPTPKYFDTDDEREDHQRKHEDRFMELVRDPSQWRFPTKAA